MTPKRTIVFVTGNANKLKEVQAIFAANPEFILENQELDLPEVQGTTQEVSRDKCKNAAKIIGGPVITEDTALCFDALGGLPGPYIKWFAKELGHEGLNRMLDGFSDRSATALCTFAYSPGPFPGSDAEPDVILFEGRTRGKIVPARGPSRFGWDPIFEVDGIGQTYAEMDPVEKNKISHRYKAIDLLKQHLGSLDVPIVPKQGFNRYYPPDFDPQKHVTLNTYHGKHALGDRARKIKDGILITRFELPFNIWCGTCDNHIGMGVRYNAEKKKVGSYFSTPIYSFRCKCHLCSGWFEIQTDPQNTRYVVVSGARKQEQDWDPEENGGFAIHESDSTAGGSATPADAFTSLEKTTTAENNLKNVVQPRISQLSSLSERRNADPYALSSTLRKAFREDKKIDKQKKEEEDALKNKFALPKELTLVAADAEGLQDEAREGWKEGRREWERDERVRRAKEEAVFGSIGLPNEKRKSERISLPVATPSSSSKAGRPRSSLPSTSTSTKNVYASALASKLLRNSLKRTDAFASAPSSSSSSRLSSRNVGIVPRK